MLLQPDTFPDRMARPVRVVVCDDSPFMRRLIRQGLERSLDIEVVGSAANAREAIELVKTLWPDVLTLDLELPDLDGVQVLHECRDLPVRVLVVSSFTDHIGTERAVEALAEGAVDVLGKPSAESTPSVFTAQLLERVRAVFTGAPYVPISTARIPDGAVASRRLIVIGASTGGPRALQGILAALPGDLESPIVVVQHMPAQFTSVFAERLDRICALNVVEAHDGMQLEAGRVHVAPAGMHLHIDGETLRVRGGAPVNGVVPSIDVTLIDAAATWGSRVTGIVLTGIGRDGCEGSRAVHAAGGRIIAEHHSTCVVYGMPKAVIETGLADRIVPLDTMVDAIVSEVYHGGT